MARFFTRHENVRDGRGFLDGSEVGHLRRVLRLAAGDRIIVFEETGREHEAVITRLTDDKCEFEVLRSWVAHTESRLRVTLAVGLTKGEKMDFVVEKATELGAHAIAPFSSEFSVPRLDQRKIEARTERWSKIALSAVKQSGRTRAPDILPVRDFQSLAAADWSDTLKLFFWERERAQSLQAVRQRSDQTGAVLVVIGPEGGFSESEADAARTHGFETVHLGPRILRAETAAVTALSLVQFLWGDGS